MQRKGTFIKNMFFRPIKRCISASLVLAGHVNTRKGIPILLYHSLDNSGSPISITPKMFKKQMEYLRDKGYRTINMVKFINSLYAEIDSTENMIILTFDDGFKSVYTTAFPILRDYGFTATVFLATNYIGRRCEWETDDTIPDIPMLSWDEVREMSKYGIEFGAHSCSHPHLTKLSINEARKEILNSKLEIETNIDQSIHLFCYPYGDFNDEIKQIVKECGFLGACNGVDFSLTHSKECLYGFKRIGMCHFNSLLDFRAGLAGTYNFYIRLKRAFLT